jgi:hypothetical protein
LGLTTRTFTVMTLALSTLKRGKLKRKETKTVFRPLQVLDVELSQPLPTLGVKGSYYGEALLLVRLHGYPIAQVVVGLEQPLSAEALAADLWHGLAPSINTFLKRHGLAPATRLSDPHLHDLVLSLGAKLEAFRSKAPLASVVIYGHQAESLEACLSSVFTLDYPNFEVILVDRSPATTKIKQIAEKMQAAGLLFHPLSPVRLANVLEHVSGEFVAFLDGNAVADRSWLLELGRAFAREKKVAAVSGLVVPAELEYQAQVWAETLRQQNRAYSFTPHPFVKRPFSLLSLSAKNNTAFRTSLLRKAGKGSRELLLELLMAGHTVLYQPSALTRQYYPRDVASLRFHLYKQGAELGAALLASLHKHPSLYLELGGLLQEALTSLAKPHKENTLATLPNTVRAAQRQGFLRGLRDYAWRPSNTAQPMIRTKTSN